MLNLRSETLFTVKRITDGKFAEIRRIADSAGWCGQAEVRGVRGLGVTA